MIRCNKRGEDRIKGRIEKDGAEEGRRKELKKTSYRWDKMLRF